MKIPITYVVLLDTSEVSQMPVLKRKTEDGKTHEWYIHIPNKNGSNPPVYTIQVEPEGRDMLLDLNLQHASQSNQAADIDWDLFYALDDLGLLYTYDSNYKPSDATPSEQSFKRLDDLSDAQRANFAKSLLQQYDPTTLCTHDHILEFFLSLESLAKLHRYKVLTTLLAGTPFDAEVIDNSKDAFTRYASHLSEDDSKEHNPLVLAFIAYFAYKAWDDPEVYNALLSAKEGYPVWVWENWVAMGGTELMFYSVNSELRKAMPDPVEQLAIRMSRSFEGRFYNLLECEFSALCAAQTVSEMGARNWPLYEMASTGFRSTGLYCIILPRPSNHESSVPGKAIEEAAGEAKSERAAESKRLFASDPP